MKYLVVLFSVLFVQFAVGQSSPKDMDFEYEYKNVLRLSPFELGWAEFQFSYERYVKNRAQSIVLTPSIITGQRGLETKDGLQLMMQYRFYLSQLQRENSITLNMYNIGFYAAPYALGLTYKGTFEETVYDPVTFEQDYVLIEQAIASFEGGGLLGVQLDVTRRIVVDFYVAGGIRRSMVDSNQDDQRIEYGIFDLAYTGVKPRIGFQIGFTF